MSEPDQSAPNQFPSDRPSPNQPASEQSKAPSVREQIFGEQDGRILDRLAGLDPDLMRYVRDFAYGEVYERPGLDLKTKELLASVLLVSLGSPAELKTHLRGALRAGASEQELREALLLCVPYLGFPRTVAAFAQLQDLLGRGRGG